MRAIVCLLFPTFNCSHYSIEIWPENARVTEAWQENDPTSQQPSSQPSSALTSLMVLIIIPSLKFSKILFTDFSFSTRTEIVFTSHGIIHLAGVSSSNSKVKGQTPKLFSRAPPSQIAPRVTLHLVSRLVHRHSGGQTLHALELGLRRFQISKRRLFTKFTCGDPSIFLNEDSSHIERLERFPNCSKNKQLFGNTKRMLKNLRTVNTSSILEGLRGLVMGVCHLFSKCSRVLGV